MKDTISRQAAIDAIITLWANKPFGNPALTEIKECIDNLPSAEPEIIRCKDCKHYHEDVWGDEIGHEDIPLILAHEMCDFWGRGCKTREDAFCSFAERIEA